MGKVTFRRNKKNQYFIENYQIVMTNIGFEDKQTICINDNNDNCRICGRTKNEVKFNNKAHAIPEAFGNKQVITNNECNECNQKYANSIENDLLNLTLPIRNVTAVSGKRGIPKYKDIKTSNSCEHKEGTYLINNYENFFKIEEENKKIILKFDTPAMHPLKAYKAFVRIALNCLPKEYFEKFKLISWLENDKDLDGATSLYTKVITKFIPKISPMCNICLFIRKENVLNVPYCQMVLQSNNVFYQVIIPFINEDMHLEKENEVVIEPFSFGVEDDELTEIQLIDLSSNEKKSIPQEFTMNYEKKETIE